MLRRDGQRFDFQQRQAAAEDTFLNTKMHAIITYLAYPWLAGLATTQAFYMLSLLGVPYASFGARALSYIMSLIFCSFYGVFASIVLRLFGMEAKTP